VKRLLLMLAGLGTAMVSVLVVLLSGHGLLKEKQGAEAQTTSRPNIVFIMTDDLDELAMEQLGGIRSIMNANGVTFENAYVTYSLCCPSRATFFRGQYPHNHGVIGLDTATPPSGDAKWRELGRDQSTVATWLNDAGYQTKYIGKYMNGYNDLYKPPGWDEWFVLQGNVNNNQVNDDGRSITLTGHSTDAFANEATDFIRRSSANAAPFFVTVGTKAPHAPPEVAARYQDSFVDTPLPRPPNFDEPDVTDKPAWVQSYPRMSPSVIDSTTTEYRQGLRSMLSVEDLLRQTIATLQDTGELGNTYIFFTSDNGVHRGQHRVPFGKKAAYEETIGVPLSVRGPGIPANEVRQQLVINNDLAPTIAELAGVNIPSFVDGKSFAPLLTSSPPSSWRTAFLEEAWKEEGGTNARVPTHKSVHTKDHILIENNTGEKELYDLNADPYQLQNKPRTGNEQLYSTLESRLNALRACSGEACRSAEWGTTPPPPPPTDTTRPRVTSTSPAANATGVAPGANVTATFSEAMMASSINGTTFKLFKKGSTTKIGAALSYDGATKKATLDPTNNLRLGTTYKAVVSTGAKDLAGLQLDQDQTPSNGLQQKTWTFTVRN
jgi:N-acetylglucosamine-6-sulfatase